MKQFLTIALLFCSIMVASAQFNMKHELEKRNIENVDRLQEKYPHESTCARCALPWSACESKVIDINEDIAVYAICTFCWQQSNLDERITFHKALYYHHRALGETEYTLDEIIKAVVNEQ